MRSEKEIRERLEAQKPSAHNIPEYPKSWYATFERRVFWDGFVLALKWVLEGKGK